MQKILAFILSMVFMQALSAQVPLSYSRNAMRTGDVLYKVKVDYVDAGTHGINQVWYLGSVSEQDKDPETGAIAGPWGMLIGGAIGGSVGAFGGSWITTSIIDYMYNK